MGLKHLTGEVKKMLSKIMAIDQNNYPEMLGHTCIINAPSIFKMIWVAIKGFIDPKTQEKIEVRSLLRENRSFGQCPCRPCSCRGAGVAIKGFIDPKTQEKIEVRRVLREARSI